MGTGYYITYKLQPVCCAYNKESKHYIMAVMAENGILTFTDHNNRPQERLFNHNKEK